MTHILFQCFYCSEMFDRKAAIENGVPHEMASMFCTSECYTNDKAIMDAEIQAAKEMDAAISTATNIPIIEELKAAGFTLKIRKPPQA